MDFDNKNHLKSCRFCNSDKLHLYLDLGNHPPSNNFISANEISQEIAFPLQVMLCEDCFASQLSYVVPSEHIFQDYAYLSSSSKALQMHYQELINFVLEKFDFGKAPLVVDIGANDGIMLDRYPFNLKGKLIGVEPSNAGLIAEEKGYHIYPSFFESGTVNKIIDEHGHADIITATNVFAHVDNVLEFSKEVERLLSKEGIFIIEFPYTPYTYDLNYFDTVYHEHLSYLSLSPIVTLFNKLGLKVFDIRPTEIGASGPAIQIFACKEMASYQATSSVQTFLDYENKWGIGRKETYENFALSVKNTKQKILTVISDILKKEDKIGCFSAPAKGNTFLNYLGLSTKEIKCIAETNQRKIGKVAPGSHIPIVSEAEFLSESFSYSLLLSWNYADYFVKNSDYTLKGGKFIIPLPTVSIR